MKVRFLAPAVAVAASLAFASAASGWAPASTAAIHPGVMTYTGGAQCTANFVYTDGANTYLGQAAHCSSTASSTTTNGCTAESLPEGTPVQIAGSDGNTYTGVMTYNSWVRMRAAGEDPNSEICQYNDLALIRLNAADVAKVNPSVPGWGGPTGTGSLVAGQSTYTYGNSSLRGGVTFLSPKQGTVLSRSAGGWSSTVYTATPGIPGDSGSGFLNASGQAAGVLSTVAIAPLAGSNGVGDLPRELSYAASHGLSASVVNGDVPFQTSLTAAIASQLGF